MKRKILVTSILLMILAACAASPSPSSPASVPATDTPAASQQQAAQVTATTASTDPTVPAAKATTEPVIPPTPYPGVPTPDPYLAPGTSTPYPAPASSTPITPLPDTTRYGVAKVDAILDVLVSGNGAGFTPLLVYASDPCTTKSGLGGPPKCQGEEKDGTMVDVLATMGPEGSFLRKSNDNLVNLPGHVQILGVFSVKADFKPEQYYPAGKYSIVLQNKDDKSLIGLRVTDDGIVRVDYLTQMPDPNNSPDMDAFLTPKS